MYSGTSRFGIEVSRKVRATHKRRRKK